MSAPAGRAPRARGRAAPRPPRKVRLNVNLDEALYWELKKKAVEDRTTVTDVVTRLVSRYVRR